MKHHLLVCMKITGCLEENTALGFISCVQYCIGRSTQIMLYFHTNVWQCFNYKYKESSFTVNENHTHGYYKYKKYEQSPHLQS